MADKQISPNLNFLLVDDDARIQRALRLILKEAGFKNIHTAENGASALKELQEKGIDVVFLDWDMPGMNGGEVLEKLQRGDMLRYTKVVMLTAHSERDYVLSAKQLGAASFIVKPFTPLSVYQKLETVLCAKLPDRK